MELGERRCRILTAVVTDYVSTAEPVGSETLVRKYDFGVKPATIRNEMAAMSDLGYLRQPHTSAGRVPSDLGYRYYVDQLMPDSELEPVETHGARQGLNSYESEIESILQRTCQILSGLSHYTSLATPPQIDTVNIRQVALLSVGTGKLLAVIVLNTGHIDHRTVDFEGTLSPSDAVELGNLLNERFRDIDLKGFSTQADKKLPVELARLSFLYKKVILALKQSLLASSSADVYIDGTSQILKQPEFTATGRAAYILDILERRRELFQILSRAILGKNVTVIIGSENRFMEMPDCSFVAASYSVGDRICGSIGVVGPTRMDYRRTVAAVKFMAQNLSELLTNLSIG